MIYRLKYIQSVGLRASGWFYTLGEAVKAQRRAVNPAAYVEYSSDQGITWHEHK